MVIEELDNRQNTEGAFFYLSKALNNIDYKTPPAKLSLHGVQGIPHQWLKYLFILIYYLLYISILLYSFIYLLYSIVAGTYKLL